MTTALAPVRRFPWLQYGLACAEVVWTLALFVHRLNGGNRPGVAA